MTASTPTIPELIERAARGEGDARGLLLDHHRDRLHRTVAVYLDDRLAARVDASDVVQEALMQADRELDDYLATRPLPFYPWLRQIARERVSQLHRFHLQAGRRRVDRERAGGLEPNDRSEVLLAERLVAKDTSPSARVVRDELRQRVREALGCLPAHDREVLTMRHLERMPIDEIAAVLGVTQGAVKMRLLRASERLRCHFGDDDGRG